MLGRQRPAARFARGTLPAFVTDGLLRAEYFLCAPHVFDDRHLEGAAALAGAAFHAIAGFPGQRRVVFPHRLGDRALRLCEAEKLRHRRDVDPGGAGRAVSAVHTVTVPAYLWQRSQGRRVILFGRGRVGIGDARAELVGSMRPGKYDGDA